MMTAGLLRPFTNLTDIFLCLKRFQIGKWTVCECVLWNVLCVCVFVAYDDEQPDTLASYVCGSARSVAVK